MRWLHGRHWVGEDDLGSLMSQLASPSEAQNSSMRTNLGHPRGHSQGGKSVEQLTDHLAPPVSGIAVTFAEKAAPDGPLFLGDGGSAA